MVHESNGSRPVTMAVKQAADCAAVHDARKGLIGFGELDVGFKSIDYPEAFQLQPVLV